MENQMGKGSIIFRIFLSTIVFSLFLKLDSIFQLVNSLVEKGWPLLPIITLSVLIRMVCAGIVVLVVLPFILDFKDRQAWLPGIMKFDSRLVLIGFLSFVIFCILAASISLGMGIFKGELSALFAFPDIRPDPDVVGWGYFMLALVPAIWEELAFRGLVLSKLRKSFTTNASILLSATFFGLYHLSNLVTQSPSQAIPGVIMAFFFGIGWAVITVKSGSIVPAMISHYLVDSMGQIFLSVDGADPALTTGFFLLLTLLFPLFNMLLVKRMDTTSLTTQPHRQYGQG